jgi:hypothetical protein
MRAHHIKTSVGVHAAQSRRARQLYAFADALPLTAAQEQALKGKASFKECTGCPDMIVVPAGSFFDGLALG